MFIAVALGFPPQLTVTKRERRIHVLTTAFTHKLADAEVSIVLAPHPPASSESPVSI